MSNSALLKCENLGKYYQEGTQRTDILRHVTFTVNAGEMVAIVGSSGSGKSTLLHLLGGLSAPTAGEIIYQGRRLSELKSHEKARLRNQELGFIYQFHHLLADFTALENVAMPLLIAGESPPIAREKAHTMLTAVGLAARWHHRPAELSGGERQRVAIARSLVNNPSLVLADEPTGNLDQHNAEKIFDLLLALNLRSGTAFIMVTHDMRLARRLNRQFEMRNGELQLSLAPVEMI